MRNLKKRCFQNSRSQESPSDWEGFKENVGTEGQAEF